MTKFNVAVIVGSLRKESLNLKLAKALVKLGAQKFDATFLEFADLPHYNQDIEDAGFPASAQKLKDGINGAHGVLIVTPEYNRSVPGALKNAIDWASRPYGKSAWGGKTIGLVGTSPSTLGTSAAQFALRQTLSHLDARIMGQPEGFVQWKDGMIDANFDIPDAKSKKFLQDYVDKFAAWIEHNEKAPGFKGADL